MKKSKKEKRPSPICLRLTFAERAQLEQAAIGMSLSAYIRFRLFGKKVAPRKTRNKAPVKDHKALSQLLGKLGQSRLSNNLNQLAKSAHIGSLPVTPETEAEIKTSCKQVKMMRSDLIRALGLIEKD